MKSQNCQSSIVARTYTMSAAYAQKPVGRQIAKLEKELAALDRYENDVKNTMQDRLKFMGGKNAYRKARELNEVTKKQEAVRAEIARLQELA